MGDRRVPRARARRRQLGLLLQRALPGKYLIPGLLFLLVYQIFVMAYTGYVAFTNYGDGHNSDQGRRDRGDPRSRTSAASRAHRRCPLTVVQQDGELGFAIVQDGEVAGRHRRRAVRSPPTTPPSRATRSPPSPAGRCWGSPQIAAAAGGDHRAAGPGLRRPDRRLGAHPGRLDRLRLPVDARVRRGRRHHDRHRDRRRCTRPTDRGNFVSEDGDVAHAGLARHASASTTSRRVFTDSRLRRPVRPDPVWTFAFAFLSVRHHVRARAVPRDRVQRPADPRPQGSTGRC